MKDTKTASLGFQMSLDFPMKSYKKVNECLTKHKDSHPIQWRSFGLGWNGVAYRYRAMTEYDKEFTKSVKSFGNSPQPEVRYEQGRALFGFFVNAVSTIECFFYATYCIASFLKPCDFSIQDPKALKSVSPANVEALFKVHFPKDALTTQMTKCVSEPAHTQIRDMRDVLSHRGMLPRNFYAGGERDGMATIPINPKDSPDIWKYDLPITEVTTALYRRWLCDNLTKLSQATDKFLRNRLK